MKEELISFETAKLAKEKGFNWWCETVGTTKTPEVNIYRSGLDNHNQYDGYYSVPTQSLLQKWFREKYNLHPYVTPYGDGKNWNVPNIRHNNKDWNEVNVPYQIKQRQFPSEFETYEQGLEFALIEMLKMIP